MSRGTEQPTRVRGRLDSIQVMRAVAALLVVLAHSFDVVLDHRTNLGESYLGKLGHIENFGAVGVDLFFIISGFVMALSVRKLSGGPGARQFLSLRWARIAPPYLIVTVAMTLLLLSWHQGRTWRGYFNALVFVPVADGGQYTTPPLDVGWTLSFEFTFYLAVAVMIVVGLARRLEILAAVLALAALVGVVADPHPYILTWLTNPILLEFAFGIVAYRLWETGRLARTRALQWGLLALAVVALLVEIVLGYGQISESRATLDATDSLLRVGLWGIPMLLLFVGFLPLGQRGARSVGGRTLRYLGDASYSIYLVHVPVLIVVGAALKRVPHGPFADAALVVGVVAATVAGVIFHRWVERPLTERVRGLFARRLHTAAHLRAGAVR